MTGDPRSHGLWARTAPPAPPTAPLRADLDVDVLVIGAGYTGLSAALHLAERGVSVAVIEAVDIGFGGSGRNVGLVNAGLWVMPDALADVLGPTYGDRLLTLLGDAPRTVFDLVARHGIPCEINPAGTLHCAVGRTGLAEITARAAQWQKRGAAVDLLDAAETARKVGSSAYSGALLDHRAGTIQPLAYVRGLAAAALAAGAAVYTQSRLRSAEQVGTRWRARCDGGQVSADWIVLATNAYTEAPWPAVRRELLHLPYFNFATPPLGDNLRHAILPERQGAWDTRGILSSFRFDAAGRLIFGSVGALRGSGTAVHRTWARRALHRLFPQVGDIAFEAEWYGMIGMTSDSVPRFHRLAPNVLSMSGYNGRGIAPGTVFGRSLAQLILGDCKDEDMPLPLTDPERPSFPRIREAYYEAGAQVAHAARTVF